jgi:hypothetical protein
VSAGLDAAKKARVSPEDMKAFEAADSSGRIGDDEEAVSGWKTGQPVEGSLTLVFGVEGLQPVEQSDRRHVGEETKLKDGRDGGQEETLVTAFL